MESPPSSSTWSEAFILSDDSGLLLTNGSASSGSMNDDSKNGRKYFAFEDSDCEERSLSQDDSFDAMSDIMYGENFNTLKKGPNWLIPSSKHFTPPIEPPPEFQDRPPYFIFDLFSEKLTSQLIQRALFEYKDYITKKLRILSQRHHHYLLSRPYITSEFIPFSPCHIGRPSSRSSLGSSRLSSSHNSLSVPTNQRLDDSNFITQAVSHDTLTPNLISDLYNVPFDSDMYSVPLDVVKPPAKPKRMQHQHKKKRRNTASGCRELESRQCRAMVNKKNSIRSERLHCFQTDTKRHSVAGASANVQGEPIHMTLHEVRQYLQTLYSSSSESSDQQEKHQKPKSTMLVTNNNKYPFDSSNLVVNKYLRSDKVRPKKNTFLIHLKNKKVKDSCDTLGKQIVTPLNPKEEKRKKSPTKLFSFKQALCNLFRFRKFLSSEPVGMETGEKTYGSARNILDECPNNICSRALPPLPLTDEPKMESDEQILDFATSIQKVKDYGWYWGPISSEAAEKILSNEPDGSFIVRDSSDDHYIFSLTFKLNNSVRHVRIEHDQGNFSFGSCTKFKSQTIVEFIENAVEHSRSGRYLFFLHRRPVIGPVRVQLLHPVSRFKQVQSLQHICRFVIHKHIRRDLIPSLPLPRRMIDYLNTPHYYSEHFIDLSDSIEEQLFPLNARTPPMIIDRNHAENVSDRDEEEADPNVPVNYIIMNNANSDIS